MKVVKNKTLCVLVALAIVTPLGRHGDFEQ